MRRLFLSLAAALLVTLVPMSSARADWTFVRGDANADGVVNFVDVINLLSHLFVVGSDVPVCHDALDVNDTGTIDLSDPIYLLQFIFEGSAPPVAPFPTCGIDASPDLLACDGPSTACPQFLTELGFDLATQQVAETTPMLSATITLTTPLTSPLTLPYTIAGSADAGEDYVAIGGSVIIAAGQLGTTIEVPLLDDLVHEGDETLAIVLHVPPLAAPLTTIHTATIVDDEPMPEVFFDGGPWTVDEGAGSVSIELRLSGLSATDIAVALAPVGSATLGLDYTLPTNPVVIPAGTLTKTVVLPILDDGIYEESEEIAIQLIGPSGATLGAAAASGITILDDDPPPTITVTETALSVPEGAGTVSIGVVIDPPSLSPITVPIVLSGTATPGADVLVPSTTLSIPPAATSATITVEVLDDGLDEADETLTLTLAAPTLAVLGSPKATTITVVDDDPTPVVAFATATSDTTESSGSTAVTVTLDTPSGRAILVPLAFGGTATSGTDIVPPASSVLIPAGSLSATIPLALIDDASFESDETVTITLGTPDGATLGSPSVHTVTILDDDIAPVLGFDLASSVFDEDAGTVSIDLALDSASPSPVTVEITLGGTATAGTDYSMDPAPVSFAPGTATMPCVITIIDDLLDEWDEDLTLTITAVSGALVGATDTHTLTIVDGDPLPVVSFLDATPGSMIEGSGGTTRTVRLDAPSGRTVTVPLITGGTATAGLDYTIAPSTVTFDPGITAVAVSLTPIDDPLDEPNESISLTLGPPTNALVGSPGTVSLTLVDDDGLPEVSFTTATSEIGETSGLVILTAALSVPSSTAISVPLSLGGTATANLDYAIAPTTLQFAAGTTSATASVIIIDDARSEDDETITVAFAPTGGAAPGPITNHTITLLDDDPLPTVSLGAAALAIPEGSGTSTLAVRLGVPAGRDVSVTVSSSGTAEPGIDLVAVPTLVTIPAGATETLIPITLIDDAEDEPDETRTLTIAPTGTAVLGSPSSCVVTVLDDDAPPTISFSPATVTGTEGSTVTLTAQLSAPSGFAISVPVTGSGTATTGGDLTPSAATIEIPAGSMSGTLTVALLADGLFEGNETWTASLGAAPRVTLGATPAATVTILDGDAPPSVSFSTAVLDLTEGNGLVRVGIDLSGPSQTDRLVSWSTTGTATLGADLVVAPNPVLVPAGSLTANLTLIVIQDSIAEPTESLVITLAPPAGLSLGTFPTLQVSLFDDADPAPRLAFSQEFLEVGEGSGTAILTAQLDAPSGSDIVAPFTVSGTATPGTDVTLPASPIVIPAGQTTASVAITIHEDAIDESDETVTLALDTPTGATLGTTTTATVRILDNDAPPVVRFASAASTVAESVGTATIAVVIEGATDATVSVSVQTAGNALLGTDASLLEDTVSFAPGTTTRLLEVAIADDLFIEGDETVSLTLASPSGATIGTPAGHQLTIIDDDVLPSVSFTAGNITVPEGAGLVPVAIALSTPSATDVTVALAVTGSALPSADFGLAPNPVVIPAGNTSGVAQLFVLDDTRNEPDETVVLTISSVTGGELGAATTRTITIADTPDPEPTVSFAQASQGVSEGAGGISVTVGLSAPSGYDLEIPILVGGTATPGVDHTVDPTTLVIPAGASFGIIAITPFDDDLDEPNETITLGLGTVLHAVHGATTLHTIQLVDDDAPPTISFASANATIGEGDAPAAMELVLDRASGRTVTVPLAITGTATSGTDIDAIPTTATIPAGAMSASIPVAPIDDLLIEGDENLTVTLGTPTNAVLAPPSACTVTLIDDDVLPTVGFTVPNQVVAENGGTTTVTIAIPAPAASDVTIPILFSGSATHFADFVATPLPVVIPAGQTSATLSVILLDDTLYEQGEEAILGFGAIANGVAGPNSTHTITITDAGDPPPTVAFAIGAQTTPEGTTSASIEVRLSAVSGTPVSVPLSVSGDAILGIDLLVPNAVAEIPAGQQSVHLPITIIDDTLDEPAETATFTLGTPSGALLGGLTTHVLTVLDNDPAPSISFAAATSSAPENSSAATVLLILSGPSAFDVAVPIGTGGSATLGADYSVSPTTVLIPAGQTEALLTVTLVDDLAVETDESVALTLGSPTGATLAAPAAHTLTIIDNDLLPTVTFGTPSTAVGEDAGIVSIPLGLSTPTATDVVVPLSTTGTATAGADYTLAPNPVTIPAGQTTAAIQLVLIDDTVNELEETLLITLGTPTGGTLGTAVTHTVTIADAGDSVPSVSFAQPMQSTTEGPGTVLLPLVLSAPSGLPVTVPLALGGSAAAGEDYTILATSIVIPAGQTGASVPLTILDDLRYELTETITATIGTPSGASIGAVPLHTVSIANDDPLPTVAFDTSASEAGEGSGTATIAVIVSPPAGVAVSVPFTRGGTALGGTDYTIPATPLVIPADTASASIAIPLIDDPFYELDETLTLTLGAPTHATLGSPTTHTLLVVDNEDVPEVSFTITGRTETEGDILVSLGISLSVPTGIAVSVPYTVSGSATSGSDFALPAGPAVIDAGSTSTFLPLVLIDDLVDEPTETVAITLGNPTGAVLGPIATQTVTILDNGDTPPAIAFALASSSAGEETGVANVTVTLDRVSGRTISVPLTISGTATAGQDFFIAPGPVTIPAGAISASIPVHLVDDLLDELPETVVITLGTPSSGTLGAVTAHTFTIADDDLSPLLTFETAASTVTEDAGTFSLRLLLDLPSGSPITVPVTFGGSALAGTDFSAPPAQVLVPPGQTEALLTVSLIDDGLFEGTESIVITLGAPTGATLGSPAAHTVTVLDDEQLPTVSFASATSQVNEGAGSFAPTIALSTPTGADVLVPYTIGGSATAGVDHDLAAGSVLIPAGQTSATIAGTILQDLLDETDEVITIALGTPTGANLGATTVHSATIIDDDPPPSAVLLTAPVSVPEGSGPMPIEIGLSAPSGRDVVISWSTGGSSLVGLDFAMGSGALTIPAGSVSASFTVDILGDLLDEADETITITLSGLTDAVAGIPASTTITILDDDAPPTIHFVGTATTTGESDGTVLVPFALDAPSGRSIALETLLGGTATPGTDYLFDSAPLTIPAGETGGFLVVAVQDDVEIESDETVVLTLLDPANANLISPTVHTITILEDDIAPTVRFATAGQDVLESAGSTSIVVELSETSGIDVLVPYTVAGSADLGVDAMVSAGPLVIPAGQMSGAIPVSIIEDLLVELDETVVVTLGAPVNGVLGSPTVHTLTIIDDEALPVATIAPAALSIGEAGGLAELVVSLSTPSTVDVAIGVTVTGTAIPGTDAALGGTPVLIPAGQTSATISVAAIDDPRDESDETVTVTLTGPSPVVIGAADSATVTILDDDPAPTASFSAAASLTEEGGAPAFATVQLSAASGFDVTIPYTIGGDASAGDASFTAPALLIPAGQTEGTIEVLALADGLDEADESLVITLGTPTNATLGAITTHTTTLVDTDPPVSLQFVTSTSSVSEDPATVQIAVELSAVSGLDVATTVVVSGTATPGADATLVGSAVTIPAGQTSALLLVDIFEDALSEGAETFVLTLGTPSGAVLGTRSSHTITIADDDPLPVVSFDLAAQSVSEGVGTATVGLTLSAPSGNPVSVPLSLGGSATAGSDYTTPLSPVVIPAGQTTALVPVSILADDIDEPNEQVTLLIGAPTGAQVGAPATHTITIEDDDVPPSLSFDVATLTVGESSGAVSIGLSLSAPSASTVTAPISIFGTATVGVDHVPSANAISIPPGALTTTLTLALDDDVLDEADETVILVIENPTGASLAPPSVLTVTIADDDPSPTVSFASASSASGESNGPSAIIVSLDAASGRPITVPFTVSGTATTGADYTIAPSPLSIPAGSTSASIAITPIADPTNEPDETVVIALGSPTNAVLGALSSHTWTLQDESDLPSVFFLQGAQTRTEGTSTALVDLRLSTPSAIPVTVALAVGGTATAGVDRGTIPTSVTFAAGVDTIAVPVPIIDDLLDEPDETIVLEILGATDAVRGLPDVHTITITDDDAAPVLTISPTTSSVGENAASATLTLTLDNASALPVTVPFTLAGSATAGTDYIAPSSPAVIPAGATDLTIVFPFIDDGVYEGNESIVATFGSPTNATLGSGPIATISIVDDESAPVATFGSVPASVGEGSGTLLVPVTLSSPSALPLTIPLSVGGTASPGSDYSTTATQISIAPGVTQVSIAIDILDDLVREPVQTIVLELLPAPNVTLGALSSVSIEIVDDEPLPVVSIAPTISVIPEAGGIASLTVTLSLPSETAITVPIATSGSATPLLDVLPVASSVVIGAGLTGAPLTVTAIDDSLYETNETLIVSLGTPSGAIPGPQGTATITITDDEPRPTLSITGPAAIGEGNGPLIAQISLSGPIGTDQTVPVTVAGTATAGTDFTPPAGLAVIPAGTLSAALTIPLIDDAIDEVDETILVSIGASASADLGSPSVLQTTLVDDDPLPTLAFAQASATVDETAGSLQVVVSLSAPSSRTITTPISLGGSADSVHDFGVSPTLLTIPAGETTGVLVVTITDDAFDEPNEIASLALGTPTAAVLGAPSTFSLTITDDDLVPAVQFDVASRTVGESAGAIGATVQVSVPSALPIEVPYTISGTATDGSDFTIAAAPLLIAPGSASAAIGVTILDDPIFEANEALTITLGTPVNASLGVRTEQQLTILDDDPSPTISFASAGSSSGEADGQTSLVAFLSAAAEVDIVVPLATGGTATPGVDAQIVGAPLLFAAGATSVTFAVDIFDDPLHEGSETLTIGFGPSVGATPGPVAQHTLTILDDDPAPVVRFATASSSAEESAGTVPVAVTLSAPSALPTTVPFTVRSLAAIPEDLSISGSPLVIPAGATSAVIELALVDDLLAEGNETVTLNLGAPTNGTLGAPSSHVFTITDDDIVPTVSFATPAQDVGEANGIVQVALVLSSVAGTDVTVPFAIAGTAVQGLDYVLPSGPVVIPAGNLGATITLTLFDDALAEPDETIVLALGTPVGATLGATTVHTTTLLDDEATPSVSFATASQSVGEGASLTTIAVLLSSASTTPVSVPLLVSGDASVPGDLTIAPDPVVIAAGTLSASITVTLVDDLLDEADEVVTIDLGMPSGAVLGAVASHALTIVDDDLPPTVSFLTAETTRTEGDAAFPLTAELSAPSGLPVSVPLLLGGDAGNPGDLTLGAPQLFFPAGATSASVTVTVVDDILSEPTETATITLDTPVSAGIGSIATHTITILDNEAFPTVDFDLATSTIGEADGSTTIGLSLDAPSAATVSVGIALTGEAATGGDAILDSPTAVFAPGTTSTTVTVSLLDDLVAEGDELLVLNLVTPSGVQIGAMAIHALTIIDDEPQPTIAFTAAADAVSEGGPGTTATLALSGARDEDTTITFALGGTATAGVDHLALPATVVIPAGDTQATLSIDPLADILDENDETVEITIASAPGTTIGAPATTTITILDDDDPPVLTFANATTTVSEGDGAIELVLLLSAASALPVDVTLDATGAPAIGLDIGTPPATATFPPGTTSRLITIPVLDDALFERPEALTVTLVAPSNATLGAIPATTVTILDDDPAPQVRFAGSSLSIAEDAGSLELTVLVGASTAVDVTVPYSVTGSATPGADFSSLPGTLTIPAGSPLATISLAVLDDIFEEGPETVVVTLGPPSDGSLGAPTVATVTIEDDDAPGLAAFALPSSSAGEAAGTASIDIVLSRALPTDVTVPVSVAGTASAGSDYVAVPASVTILAGATSAPIDIALLDDLVDEVDETIVLTLGSPTGAGLGTPSVHTLTLLDDEASPVLALVETSLAGDESGAALTLTVGLDTASGLAVTVPFTLTGTATDGEDYTITAGPLTIPAGSVLTSLTITPQDDAWDELDETVIVTLDSPTNATLGTPASATVTLLDDDPTPSVALTSTGESVSEGGGARTLTLELSSPSDLEVAVPLAITGTATDGEDFVIASNTVTIPPRTLTRTFTVTILEDTIDEPTETISIALGTPANATLGVTTAATISILDDDPTPTLTFVEVAADVGEADTTVAVGLALSNPSASAITVPFTLSGTATSGDDYTVPASPLTIPAGDTAAFLVVTIIDDLIADGDETFVITLDPPSGAILGLDDTFTGTILDDETSAALSFSAAASSLSESAGSVLATVELSIPSAVDLMIPITVGGTATAGVDAVITPNPVVIPAGQLVGSVAVVITDDLIDELDETVELTLLPPVGTVLGTPATHTVTILDDDATPTVSFVAATSAVAEGAGSILVEVGLSAPSGLPVTVPVTLGGTADLPADATVSPLPLVIPAGSSSGFLTVDVVGDLLHEIDESLTITLDPPTNAGLGATTLHTLTITDDDAAPTVAFALANSSTGESGGTALVDIALDAASGLPVTVSVGVSGTATPGVDFTAPAATATIPAGSTSLALPVAILGDLLDEDDETVVLTLSAPIDASLGTLTVHTLTILDDDNEPTVGFATANVSIIEDNGPATIDLGLSPITGRDVTVTFSVAGTATDGVDYTAPATTVVIPAGNSSALVTVPITADLLDEPDETVVLTITSVTNALTGGISTTTLTINDDDDAPNVSFATAASAVGESDGPGTVDVILSGASGRTVTVPFTTGGTATLGDDATVSSDPLTFAPGETVRTITVTPVDDLLDEIDETVVLSLGTPVNAIRVAPEVHTRTILDDDASPTIAISAVVDAAEPATDGGFTIAISEISALPVTATLAVAGTALPGVDVGAIPGSVTIPAGLLAAAVPLAVLDDAIFEGDETVELTISAATNATIGAPASATATITDDETIPSVTFSAATSAAVEGVGSVAIAVTLSGESSAAVTVPVTLSGTASGPTDTTVAPVPLVIPAGALSANLTVTVVDDAVAEPVETLVLDLGGPAGATLGAITSHTLTITDDDGAPTVAFANTAASLDESGGVLDVVVTLSAASALDVTVPFSVGGSADGSDRTVDASPLVIPAGNTQGTISITVTEDVLAEGNETVVLTLNLPTNATVGSPGTFTLTILDNDAAPTVRFATASQSVTEGVGSTTIGLELSASSGLPVTVDLVLSGTATVPDDASLLATQLTIPAGQLTATATLSVAADTLYEVDETVVVTIDAASGATIGSPTTHTVTITDDDLPPTVSFAIAASSVGEGAGTATIDAVLDNASGLPVTVAVSAGGTASAADATLDTTLLTFAPGAVTASATVTIVQDALSEPTETVVLTLASPTNAGLGTPSVHTLSITDDDAEPVVAFTATAQTVVESVGTVTIDVTAAAASGVTMTVPFSLGGTATNGVDYSSTASPLTFAPGVTSATITLTITPDALDELAETIEVTLDPPTGATLGTNTLHTVTITDDDGQPSVSFDLAASTAGENTGTAQIRVVLSTPSGLDVTVPFVDTGAGSATVGLDYTAPTSPLLIPAGATEGFIAVPLIDDGDVEPDETVTLQMLTPGNAIFGAQASHVLTIMDDDGAAPCLVAYPDPEVVLPPGVAITPLVPTFACGAPTSWSVAPALPTGLTFDTGTGTISGTPTTRTPRAEFTVTATNANGSDATVIAIRIDPIFEFFAGPAIGTYDPVSGNLIPEGGTLPDPLATVPVSLFLQEGPNNDPVPNTFTPTVGLSVALQYDAAVIDPQQVEEGADLIGMNGGTGPDFWGPQIGANVVTVGVLYSIDPGGFLETLTADVAREIAIVRYAPATGTLVGDVDGATVTMSYGNPNGPTAVQNEVVLDGSTGVDPVTTDVVVEFVPTAP